MFGSDVVTVPAEVDVARRVAPIVARALSRSDVVTGAGDAPPPSTGDRQVRGLVAETAHGETCAVRDAVTGPGQGARPPGSPPSPAGHPT